MISSLPVQTPANCACGRGAVVELTDAEEAEFAA
jgi:hypothetical protein